MSEMLPFRFKLLEYLGSVETASPATALVALKSEYGQMKYFKKKEVEEHFLSMKANGIADEVNVTFDENGDLECFYTITEYGRSLLDKYLPKWYKTS